MAQAGERSLEAFWIGGASRPTGIHAGYRSYLAYWMGGASCPTGTPPPPFPVGLGGSVPYYTRYPTIPKRNLHYERLLRDDEDLLIILEAE